MWLMDWAPACKLVTCSIPSQGICLGCRSGPQLGACKEQPQTDVSLPFSLLPPSLKINKIFKKIFSSQKLMEKSYTLLNLYVYDTLFKKPRILHQSIQYYFTDTSSYLLSGFAGTETLLEMLPVRDPQSSSSSSSSPSWLNFFTLTTELTTGNFLFRKFSSFNQINSCLPSLRK